MNKNLIIYLIFIGLIGLLSNCKKDETKVVILTTPNAPTFKTVPDLTLIRDKGKDTLVFLGTLVNPGFQASATYFLEVDTAGNQFKNPTVLVSDIQDTVIKLTVSDLNGLLIRRFPTDKVSSLQLRIRSVLVADAGTGAKSIVSISDAKDVSVTTYGLPRLDLIAAGVVIGKIESPLGDGSYSGYVKLDKTKPFTLKDPDANVVYGVSGSTLVVNGTTYTPADNGWYKFSLVDTKLLKFTAPDPYFVGLVGSATANGWNSPDTKMDYDSKSGTWYITTNLTDDHIKFRLNDGWNTYWGGKGTGDGTPDNYSADGISVPLAAGGKNIGLLHGAGSYTIHLDIKGNTATIVKN